MAMQIQTMMCHPSKKGELSILKAFVGQLNKYLRTCLLFREYGAVISVLDASKD